MSDALITASVVIRSPLLEVFDYVADPRNLPEWVPLYSEIRAIETREDSRATRGDRFAARISLVPSLFRLARLFDRVSQLAAPVEIEVCLDDVVHGRRIAYRSNIGWTTICDFESSGNQTIFTVTESFWSLPGLWVGYWMGPMHALAKDMQRTVLEGLKRRLEGRAVSPEPKIFFSYRRSDARYVGGRIFDALTAEFGIGTVFRDSNSLLAGGDWANDIRNAIRRCRVVVVHIGDNWEATLQERADGEDGLRDELEAALAEGTNIRIVPVLTSERDRVSLHERMSEVAQGVRALGDKAPHMCQKFTRSLQVQLLREDPDFSQDLERLMRAIWVEFRS